MSESREKLGAAWEVKFENSSKPKFNVQLDPKAVEKMETNKHGEVKLAFVKQTGELKEKSPSHDIVENAYKAGEKKEQDNSEDLYVNINKDKFLEYSKSKEKPLLEVIAKKNESVGKDRSDYFVRTMGSKGGDGSEREILGRAWSPTQTIENKNYVGNAFKKEFDDGGKAYNVFLKKDDVEKLKADDYGNIRLSMAERKDSGKENTPTHSVYQSVGKEPYNEASLSLNKEKVLDLPANDYGYVAVSVVDKLNISKDKSDLTAYENVHHIPSDEEKKRVEFMKDAGKKEEPGRNFVGGGWTNKPDMIRLQKEDKTPDGLTKAISNNHLTKVQAILNAKPSVVQKKHMGLVDEMEKSGANVDKSLSTTISNAYENKQSQKSGITR